MNLAAFVLGLVGPVAARLLSSLGLSLLVMTGLDAMASGLKDQVLANLHGLPATALQLGGLFGIGDCIGLWLGAVAFVVAWNAASGFWSVAKS